MFSFSNIFEPDSEMTPAKRKLQGLVRDVADEMYIAMPPDYVANTSPLFVGTVAGTVALP